MKVNISNEVAIKELSEVVNIDGGYAFKSDKFVQNKTPIIRIGNIVDGNVEIDYSIGYDIEDKKFDKYLIQKNDILIAMSGATTGKLAMYRNNIIALLNQRVGRFNVIDKNVLDNSYLYFYLRSEFVQSNIKVMASGCAQPNISPKQLLSIQIPIPSLENQKKIVEVLEKIEKALEKRKESNRLLDEYLKSVFVEMFGDPVKNEKGWGIISLSELGTWASGGTPSRKIGEYFEGEINWFSAGELNSMYLVDSNEKITEKAINESSAKVFKKGSLLIGMYDTAAFKMGILTKESSSNQACTNVNINNEICKVEWLYFNLMLMKEHFLSQRRGVRQKNLNLGMIKEFTIPLPTINLQEKFANIIYKTEQLKKRNVEVLDELEHLFNSLMKDAFNGTLKFK